tara:strand:- start:1618 stop:1827 length:210 start_codon:yes stop_codon:yes gene_type:complete
MPIHNEIFESYRQQVKKIDKAMRLLVTHGYKIIDLENQLIHRDNIDCESKRCFTYNRTPKKITTDDTEI